MLEKVSPQRGKSGRKQAKRKSELAKIKGLFPFVRYCKQGQGGVGYKRTNEIQATKETNMADEQKRGRGRPATYSSDAERARAWRERQKELIAQAQAVIAAPAAAPVVEAPVIEPPAPKPVRRRRKEPPTPVAVGVKSATALGAVLREQLKVNKDAAKVMRTKAAQTATFIKDLKERAKGRWNSEGLAWDAPEHAFLQQCEVFFSKLNEELEVAQRYAKREEEDRQRKWEDERLKRFKAIAAQVLGPEPRTADVLAMAADLDVFDGHVGRVWLAKRYNVAFGSVSTQLTREGRTNLYSKDARHALLGIAEAYEHLAEEVSGRIRLDYNNERYVSGCWNDFIAWRAERATKAG